MPSPMVETASSPAVVALPVRQAVKTCDPEFAAEGIDAQDWDLLFTAVLETLPRVACGKTLPDGAALRLQTPADVLGGCLEALEQLRQSVPSQSLSGCSRAAHR